MFDIADLNEIYKTVATEAFLAGYRTALLESGLEDMYRSFPTVKSTTFQTYIGNTFKRMRQWQGGAKLPNSPGFGTISLRTSKYEATAEFPFDAFDPTSEVGQAGLAEQVANIAQDAGETAALNDIFLLLGVLEDNDNGHDGVSLFSTSHPATEISGSFSNDDQGGGGPNWYLADTTLALKPLYHGFDSQFSSQRVRGSAAGQFSATPLPRSGYVLTAKRQDFESLYEQYSVEGEVAVTAGFGFGMRRSNQALTLANLRSAREAMSGIKGPDGRPLGVRARALIVPSNLVEEAKSLVAPLIADGGAAVSGTQTDLRVVESLYLSVDT